MARIKIDQETLGLASVMERITHARVKDCFKEGDTLYFVVFPGELGKAIGKGGIMIKKLTEKMRQPVKIVEFRNDAVGLVTNLLYPVRVQEVVSNNGLIIIRDEDRRKKGLIIGRSGSNLAFINRVVRRYYDVEVKIE